MLPCPSFSFQVFHVDYRLWVKVFSRGLPDLGLYPLHSFLFIRTSKFCLRLAVLIFFFIFEEMFLICSYLPDWTLQCHKEECQAEYKENTLFHFFHSFSFIQRTYRQPVGGVLQKIDYATVLKPMKKYLRRSSIIQRLPVCNFTNVELLHRCFS